MEEVTIKGLWWLPELPDTQLSGEVTYGPNSGVRLSLFGRLFPPTNRETSTVWGMTVNGKEMTLFGCYTKNLTQHFPGAEVSEIVSSWGVVGGHIKAYRELKFAKVFVELTHLQAWAATTGIKIKDGPGFQVVQEPLPDVPLGLVNGLKLALEFTWHIKWPRYGECILCEDCFLSLEAESPTIFETFEKAIFTFQHFIALGVGRPATRQHRGSNS